VGLEPILFLFCSGRRAMSAHEPCARKPHPRHFRGDRRCDRIRAALQRPQTSPRFVGNDGGDRRQTAGAASGAFRFRRHEAAAAERQRSDAANVAALAEGGRLAPFDHQSNGTRALPTVGDSGLRKRPCCNREALAAAQQLKMRLVVKSGSSRRGSPRSRSGSVPETGVQRRRRRGSNPGFAAPGQRRACITARIGGTLRLEIHSEGRRQMSRAIAICHGGFGRATIYQIDRPFDVHTHREGHLVFHVGGPTEASTSRTELVR